MEACISFLGRGESPYLGVSPSPANLHLSARLAGAEAGRVVEGERLHVLLFPGLELDI